MLITIVDEGTRYPARQRNNCSRRSSASATRQQHRVGLGLSVARGFVEGRWAATISATDTPGRRTDHGGGPRRTAGKDRVTNQDRVLVIDDEPQILRALRINLSVRGYDV